MQAFLHSCSGEEALHCLALGKGTTMSCLASACFRKCLACALNSFFSGDCG